MTPNGVRCIGFLVVLVVLGSVVSHVSSFNLIVLHTNDVHARIEQFDVVGGQCKPNGTCFGGVARRKTAVDAIRSSNRNTLLLDAGDQFLGTLWFNYYKGDEAALFMNSIGYDVMSFGNHEFDDGIQTLVRFVRKLNFSIICANANFTKETGWPTDLYPNRSKVIEIDGNKVGIIGYLTVDTKWLSKSVDVEFSPEVESVTKEAELLNNQGVKIIIALGHAGYTIDKKIAAEVPYVDIVVGGHTNTFLYTGSPPSIEVPENVYPFVVTSKFGRQVLVVQDYTLGKYLGVLNVTFDQKGEVVKYSGNPVLLDSSFVEDPKILKVVQNMAGPVLNTSRETIGYTKVLLDGSMCRLKECNLGNLIADALVDSMAGKKTTDGGLVVYLALWNGGDVRSSIYRAHTDPITVGDVLTVLPFSNTADYISLSGSVLMEVFEHSVTGYDPSYAKGRFLQMSGFKVVYNLNKPEGKRVKSLLVRNYKNNVEVFEPVNLKANYTVLLNNYLCNGGDNYVMLQTSINQRIIGSLVPDIIIDYIKKNSPISPKLEGRITFDSAALSFRFSLLAVIPLLVLLLLSFHRRTALGDSL